MSLKDGGFDKAVKLNIEYAITYFNRGCVYYEKEEYDRAITVFSKAIEINPDFTEAYFNRGLSYLWKEARSHYLSPDLDLQKIYLALSDFNTTLLYNPEHYRAWHCRGMIYAMEGIYLVIPISTIINNWASGIKTVEKDRKDFINYEEAQRSFNEALRISPDFTAALLSRGKMYKEQKKYDQALNDFEAFYI